MEKAEHPNKLVRQGTLEMLQDISSALEKPKKKSASELKSGIESKSPEEVQSSTSTCGAAFTVVVQSATGLKQVREEDKQDPFVVLTYADQQFRSPEAFEGHLDPSWGPGTGCTTYSFERISSPNVPLEVQVFDQDVLSDTETLLGVGSIDLSSESASSTVVVVELKDPECEELSAGTLQLLLEFDSQSSSPHQKIDSNEKLTKSETLEKTGTFNVSWNESDSVSNELQRREEKKRMIAKRLAADQEALKMQKRKDAAICIQSVVRGKLGRNKATLVHKKAMRLRARRRKAREESLLQRKQFPVSPKKSSATVLLPELKNAQQRDKSILLKQKTLEVEKRVKEKLELRLQELERMKLEKLNSEPLRKKASKPRCGVSSIRKVLQYSP